MIFLVKSKVRLFADDTSHYLTISTSSQSEILQKDLDNPERWSHKWDMEFNPSICQVIHITRSKNPIPTQYTLHNCILESVSSAKYLGVDLSWNTHINRISKKANDTLGFLRRNIKIHSESLKSSAYKVLVHPQLECLFTDCNISKLEAVQRRAARWVKHDYGQTTPSVTDMMQSLYWRRLDQRRIDNKLSLLYKISHNLIAIPISDFLIPLVRPSRQYHSSSYMPITATTDYYKCSYWAVFHWNNLSLETVACPSLEQSARLTTSHHRKSPYFYF